MERPDGAFKGGLSVSPRRVLGCTALQAGSLAYAGYSLRRANWLLGRMVPRLVCCMTLIGLGGCRAGAPADSVIEEAIREANAAGRVAQSPITICVRADISTVEVLGVSRNDPPVRLQIEREDGDTVQSDGAQWIVTVRMAGLCHQPPAIQRTPMALPRDSADFFLFEVTSDQPGELEYLAFPAPSSLLGR